MNIMNKLKKKEIILLIWISCNNILGIYLNIFVKNYIDFKIFLFLKKIIQFLF